MWREYNGLERRCIMRTFLALALVGAGLMSCENKAETGALAGAGIGALSGGLIAGNATGAVIGGAIGAVGGGLIGYALDQQDRENLQRESPQTLQRVDQGQPLSVQDIKAMSRAGIKDEVIMSQIDSSGTVYHLSTEDIIDLKNAGVSQNVIDYMINTANR